MQNAEWWASVSIRLPPFYGGLSALESADSRPSLAQAETRAEKLGSSLGVMAAEYKRQKDECGMMNDKWRTSVSIRLPPEWE